MCVAWKVLLVSEMIARNGWALIHRLASFGRMNVPVHARMNG